MKTDVKSNHTICSFVNLFDLKQLVFLSVIFVCLNCFGQNFSIIGNGTGSNATTTYPAPYGLYYYGAKHQFLLTATELTAAGVPAGASISSIGFNVISDNGADIHNGFQVIVYSATNADPLLSGYVTAGQVSSSTSTNYNPTTGWNQHALTSFTWNGTSNLVIQTCFNNLAFTVNATTQWTSTLAGTSVKSRYFYQDASAVCSSTIATATSSTTRPNIRIGWTASASASNDLVCNATLISCGQTLSGSTINSTLSGTGEGLNCGTPQTLPGVWYSIPGNGQSITASLCGTSWDSKLSIFSGSSCSSLTCVGGVDDNGPSCSSTSASYSWNSVSGMNYYILVHGYNSNSAFSIFLSCTGNAPTNPTGITISETSGNNANDGMICFGGTAQLSVSGSSGITYWFSGTCGSATSSSIGNGINLNVSPAVTTTYYSRNYSGGIWSSSCVSYTVTVNSLPSAPSNPTSNSPQCNSVTITRSGVPPAGVTWYWQGTNANGTSTSLGSGTAYTATTSGIYYIRSQNSSGCWSSSSGSLSITISTGPIIPANPTSNSPQCTSVTLTRSGTPPVGVTWYWQGTNPSGTSITLGSGLNYTAVTSGTYYIRARNSSGCWSASSGLVNVTISSLPSSPQNPTSDSPQCTSVTLSRSGSPPAGVTWYWQGTNPNGTSTILGTGANYTVSSSGTYYLRAMSSIGCWSASSGSVVATITGLPQAPAVPGSNSPNCGSVNISWNGTPPASTTWYWQGTNANGTSTILGSGANYAATSTGTYYLRARTSNNCWSTLSAGLPVIVLSSSSATQNQVVCDSYVAPDGLNYSNSGQYQAIISNSAGCDSIITINLTVNSSYSVQNTVLACQSYTWIDGNTYTEDNDTTTYMLTSTAGCDSLVTLDLDISLPSSDTTYIQSTALGSFELNGIVYSEDGIYYQTLPNQYGCISTIALELFIEQVSIDEYNVQFISIYPNPSETGLFFLDSDKTFTILHIYDSHGRKVNYRKEGNSLDLRDLEKGCYFVHLETEFSVFMKKIIFQ